MKTLLLIRHAESDTAEAGQSDHERPLNGRGRRDAPEMARRLKQRGVKPDLLISSTAVRAHATASLLAEGWDLAPALLRQDGRLYASSISNLLYIIQELDDSLTSVALVGHNPEMSELGQYFSPGFPDLPTCAVAQLDFNAARWSDLEGQALARTIVDAPRKGRE